MKTPRVTDVPMDQVGEAVMAAIFHGRRVALATLREEVQGLRPGSDWPEYQSGFIDATDIVVRLINRAIVQTHDQQEAKP